VLAVLLFLYCSGSLYGLYRIFRRIRQHQKWGIAIALFLICGERVVACVIRIVWVFRKTNVRISVASQIFLQAGSLLLLVINLLLAGSLLRTTLREQVWLSQLLATLASLITASFIMVITSITLSVYTSREQTRTDCRYVQRAAATNLLVVAVVPLVMLVVAVSRYRLQSVKADREIRVLATITTISSSMAVLITGFKAGILFKSPAPLFSSTWYYSKASLYCFQFLPEVLVLMMLFLMRVDVRYDAVIRQRTQLEGGCIESRSSLAITRGSLHRAKTEELFQQKVL